MSESKRDLRTLGGEWAEAVAADLSGLSGLEVSVSAPDLESSDRDALLPRSGQVVCSRCTLQDDSGACVYFVMPLRAALLLAVAASGTSPDDFEAFATSAFEGEAEASYREAIDLCAGILGRVFDEEAGLPSLQLEESTLIELAARSETPPAGGYLRASFQVEIAGVSSESLGLFVEDALASAWFGTTAASVAGDSSVGSVDQAIAIVDPSAESREAFALLVEELGARVLAVDPEDLGGEAFDDLAEATWVVTTWDLGGRSGMDLLERLRADDATAELRVALASPIPTRAMVEAALRWGAQTLLLQPWDPAEIRERLFEP